MNKVLEVFKRGLKMKYFISFVLIYLVIGLFQVPNIHAANNYPLILGAHRGNSVEFTENTLEAIQNALEEERYQFLEFDIQYTKDKKVVVFHDQNLLRMQIQMGTISDLTYEELSKISTYHIPLFEEVMDLITPQKRINIEIKSHGNLEEDQELVDHVIQECIKKGVLRYTLLSSLSSEIINYISKTYPKLKTGMIYWIHPVTYLPFEAVVQRFYQNMTKIGADYIMLHGINLKNYDLLISLKPKDQTLVFWYFNDQMLVMQKDVEDRLW